MRGQPTRPSMRPCELALALTLAGCFIDEPSATSDGTASATTTADTTTGSTSLTSSTSSTSETTAAAEPICGDGKIEGDEACDSGDLNGTMSLCKLDCTLNVCGDGVVSPIEECDDGDDVDVNACSNACLLARCGDEVTQIGESCDDGNAVDGDGCSAGCVLESCGNGTLDPQEACDDGNAVNDDGCTNACTEPACGDGILQAGVGEECDDGPANVDGLACSSNCRTAKCGDGILQDLLDEACDDADLDDGDGCSSQCQRDAYFAFISGNTYDGNLGGRVGADGLCQDEAEAAGLLGTYRAWLSDNNGSPQQDFVKTTMPYIRVDGVVLATGWDDLVTNKALKAPLNVTAAGEVLVSAGDGCSAENSVWTNTEVNGSVDNADDCSDWFFALSGKGSIGRFDRIDSNWTDAACNANCVSILRIYCFEEP